jgi:hypothetical protein
MIFILASSGMRLRFNIGTFDIEDVMKLSTRLRIIRMVEFTAGWITARTLHDHFVWFVCAMVPIALLVTWLEKPLLVERFSPDVQTQSR